MHTLYQAQYNTIGIMHVSKESGCTQCVLCKLHHDAFSVVYIVQFA